MSEVPEEEIILPIEDNIDLHHFHPRDIPSLVEATNRMKEFY